MLLLGFLGHLLRHFEVLPDETVQHRGVAGDFIDPLPIFGRDDLGIGPFQGPAAESAIPGKILDGNRKDPKGSWTPGPTPFLKSLEIKKDTALLPVEKQQIGAAIFGYLFLEKAVPFLVGDTCFKKGIGPFPCHWDGKGGSTPLDCSQTLVCIYRLTG